MSKAKIVYVSHLYRNHWSIYAGTVAGLVSGPFSYDLECGHSWNDRIPRFPKTAKSLVNALNKSADECHPYGSDRYEISSEEEFLSNGGVFGEDMLGITESHL